MQAFFHNFLCKIFIFYTSFTKLLTISKNKLRKKQALLVILQMVPRAGVEPARVSPPAGF